MIETEHTPNPDTLKFLPGKKVSEVGPVEFLKSSKNISVPLANKILSLEGISMVFFGEDFITVKKEKGLKWNDLKHNIISEINHYYSQGNSVIIKKITKNSLTDSKPNDSKTDSKPNDSNEIVNKINEVLDSKVRPAVAKDGGDITFKSFNDGVVTVELKGSCSGCPSSTLTLKQGVQNLLCHYIPEVKSVEAN
jgi:Fe-S cluster biogenesis protein NfuA